jgi:hypothetical protein
LVILQDEFVIPEESVESVFEAKQKEALEILMKASTIVQNLKCDQNSIEFLEKIIKCLPS